MIYPYGNLAYPKPFGDNRVDEIINEDGVIDQFAPINLKLSDKKLIENINNRIEDSRAYFNDDQGFNKDRKAAENLRFYLGIQLDSNDFYEGEDPYIENQIRGAVDSIVAYTTARSPQSTVTPASGTPEARKFASNLEVVHNLHSLEHGLREKIEVVVRSWLLYREGYILLEFDPSYGDNGDIIPRFIPADEIVVDKDSRFDENPGFITLFEKQTTEALVNKFPEKKQAIFDELGIQRQGSKNMTQEIVTKKTWFTYFDPKEQMAKEAICIYFDNCMLGRFKDPNWLEGEHNFLNAPMKPIIPLNVINDGKHWIDFSTPVDDGIKLQRQLNSRGNQIAINASTANGTTVVNGKTSGLTKEDVQNWTQRANQKIWLKKARDGVAIDQMISTIPGKEIPAYVVSEKTDMRNAIGMVMSVPFDQTGSDETGDDPTLGQSLLKKSNAQGRQDMIVRGLDRFLHKYFNLLTQLEFVWYDEEHYFPYLDADGGFENIVIKRYYFDEGMRVSVKGGTTIAFDKNREQAMAIHLLEKNQLSLLDGYRIIGFENPQKLYDNWAKQTKDPWQLVRDADESNDEGEAYAEFIEFMAGKEPKIREDANENYILTLRKMMLRDLYLEAKSSLQVKFATRVQHYVDRFQLRHSLDQLGQEGLDKVPMNNAQIPQPVPDQQFQQMMAPAPPPPPGMPAPAPPPGMPGTPPQQPGMPGAPMPPPQGPPMGMPPPAPGPSMPPGIFNGTPINNPASPQTPSGISAIPSI